MLENILAKAFGVNKKVEDALSQFITFEAAKIDAPVTDVAIMVTVMLVDHPTIPDAAVAYPRFVVMRNQDYVRDAVLEEIVEQGDAPKVGSKISQFFVNEHNRLGVEADELMGLITVSQEDGKVIDFAEFVRGEYYDMFTIEDVINEKRPSNYKKPEQ